MIIFINDIPLRILNATEVPHPGHVNHIIDAATEPVVQALLIHHVWIKNVSEKDLDVLLGFLTSKVPTNLLSLFITAQNYRVIKSHLKSKFKIVKAAGGVIRKKDK